jgi:hypothetical protein
MVGNYSCNQEGNIIRNKNVNYNIDLLQSYFIRHVLQTKLFL